MARKLSHLFLVLVFTLSGFVGLGRAEDKPPLSDIIKPSFLLFGDLYTIPSHHLDTYDGESGWWTRRIYATIDAQNFGLGDTVVRLRLEANQTDEPGESDYDSSLKDAYLELRPSDYRITLGRSPTVTFDRIEKHWGYRWFEKTPMDLQGASSRVDGLVFKGPMPGNDKLGFRFAAGEGKQVGFTSEDVLNLQGAISYTPSEVWTLDFYLDYLDEADFDQRASTFQAFAGWTGDKRRAGVQWSYRDYRDRDDRINMLSAYYVQDLKRGSVVGRLDRLFEPSIKGDGIAYLPFDPSAEATLVMLGFDFPLHPAVNLMPNIKYIYYDENDGERPEDDFFANLTLYISLP